MVRPPPAAHTAANQNAAGYPPDRATASPASGAPRPTPMSKNAVTAPSAAPRWSSGVRDSAMRASDGNRRENEAPMIAAPASATGSEEARARVPSPTASAPPATRVIRTGPRRSGSEPSTTRPNTTEAAKAVNTAVPCGTPSCAMCRTTKPATVP